MRTLVSLVSILALTACSTTPKGPKQASISQEGTVEAKVVSVETTTRELTLERDDGTTLEVVAGPEVRNFDQIRAGDTVKTRYRQTLSARILDEEEADTEATMTMGAGRAAPGERPGVGFGAGFQMTVTVESVDVEQNLVVFTDPSNQPHVVRPEREEGKNFIAGLKRGDRVEIVYDEAVGISVE